MNMHRYFTSILLHLFIACQLSSYHTTTIFALPSSFSRHTHVLPYVSSHKLTSQLQNYDQEHHQREQRHTYKKRNPTGKHAANSHADLQEVQTPFAEIPHSLGSFGSMHLNLDASTKPYNFPKPYPPDVAGPSKAPLPSEDADARETAHHMQRTLDPMSSKLHIHLRSPHPNIIPISSAAPESRPPLPPMRGNEADQESKEEFGDLGGPGNWRSKANTWKQKLDQKNYGEVQGSSHRKREPTSTSPVILKTPPPHPLAGLEGSHVFMNMDSYRSNNPHTPLRPYALDVVGPSNAAMDVGLSTKETQRQTMKEWNRRVTGPNFTSSDEAAAIKRARLSKEMEKLTIERLDRSPPPGTPVSKDTLDLKPSQSSRPVRPKRPRAGPSANTEIEPYPETDEEFGERRDPVHARKKRLDFGSFGGHKKRAAMPMDNEGPPKSPSREQSFRQPVRTLSAPAPIKNSGNSGKVEASQHPTELSSDDADLPSARETSPHFATRLASFHDLKSIAESLENISLERKPRSAMSSPSSHPDSPPSQALGMLSPLDLSNPSSPSRPSGPRNPGYSSSGLQRSQSYQGFPNRHKHSSSPSRRPNRQLTAHPIPVHPSPPVPLLQSDLPSGSSPESPSLFGFSSSSPDTPSGPSRRPNRGAVSSQLRRVGSSRVPTGLTSEGSLSSQGTPKRPREFDDSDQGDIDKKSARLWRKIVNRRPRLQSANPGPTPDTVSWPESPVEKRSPRFTDPSKVQPEDAAGASNTARPSQMGSRSRRQVSWSMPTREQHTMIGSPDDGAGRSRTPPATSVEHNVSLSAGSFGADTARIHESFSRYGLNTAEVHNYLNSQGQIPIGSGLPPFDQHRTVHGGLRTYRSRQELREQQAIEASHAYLRQQELEEQRAIEASLKDIEIPSHVLAGPSSESLSDYEARIRAYQQSQYEARLRKSRAQPIRATPHVGITMLSDMSPTDRALLSSSPPVDVLGHRPNSPPYGVGQGRPPHSPPAYSPYGMGRGQPAHPPYGIVWDQPAHPPYGMGRRPRQVEGWLRGNPSPSRIEEEHPGHDRGIYDEHTALRLAIEASLKDVNRSPSPKSETEAGASNSPPRSPSRSSTPPSEHGGPANSPPGSPPAYVKGLLKDLWGEE